MNNLQFLCGVEQKHMKNIQPNWFTMQQWIIPDLQ